MIPTGPDLVALFLKVGSFFLEFGPFILFGAVVAAARLTLFRNRLDSWSGDRLIAVIAALPLGLVPVFAAAVRAPLWRLTVPATAAPPRDDKLLRRATAFVDPLILPFLLSAVVGAVLVVLTPTEPLWSLFSAPSPWRIVLAPLVVGLIRPRGGTELPLALALITKGLDPAGAAAAIAGAGYLRATSTLGGAAHLAVGVGVGLLVWALGMTSW